LPPQVFERPDRAAARPDQAAGRAAGSARVRRGPLQGTWTCVRTCAQLTPEQVRPSSSIKMFLTPYLYSQMDIGVSPDDLARLPDLATPSVRAGVVQVFQTRSPRLDVALCAKEAGVPQDWLEVWLKKAINVKVRG
jgi:hypothetical protein